jgi:hypothetical protein
MFFLLEGFNSYVAERNISVSKRALLSGVGNAKGKFGVKPSPGKYSCYVYSSDLCYSVMLFLALSIF